MANGVALARVPLIGGNKSRGRRHARRRRRARREAVGAVVGRPGAVVLGARCSASVAIGYQIATGIGTWGLNRTVGWAFDITNFVFWIGIGHAGTLISAILFLLRQRWRTSVNRAAEAMTLFAVMCAGLFPLIHMGRPWMFFWMLPYPNDARFALGELQVAARLGLLRDQHVFHDLRHLLVRRADPGPRDDTRPGTGHDALEDLRLPEPRLDRIVPDLAPLRGGLSAAGGARHARSSSRSTPSSAPTSRRPWCPGWHTTIFPPYFVAGAIFSGMAMVLTLMLVARKTMRLEDYITPRHIDAMCSLVILTSGLVGLAYGTEFFIAYYSGNPYEQFAFYQPRARTAGLGLLDHGGAATS